MSIDLPETLARARSEPLPRQSLEMIVERVAPGARLVDVAPMVGGLGSVMDRLTIEHGTAGDLVLRRLLPEWGDDAASLRSEVTTHRLLRQKGLAVPRVRWSDAVGDAFGRPSLVMDFVTGRPIAPDLAGPEAASAMADACAALHALPASHAHHLDLLATADDYLSRYGPSPTTSPVVDAAALTASLGRLPELDPADRCLVHGDLHGGNVLWDGTRVTAMLDWTGAGRGAAWWDVGYLWMDTALMHGRAAAEAVVAAYAAAGGAGASAEEQWYWRGVALIRALPDPSMWLPAYRATGVEGLDAEVLRERFATLVARHLDEAP